MSYNYSGRSRDTDAGLFLALMLLMLLLYSCYQQSREDACTRNGWTPVYGGKYASIQKCERTVNGNSEVTDPANLPVMADSQGPRERGF